MSNLGVDFGQWEDSVRHSEMMSKLCVCETSTIRPPCISRSRVHVSVCVWVCVYACVHVCVCWRACACMCACFGVPDSVPFFERRPGPYCAKPSRVWSGWPGQGLAKRIWSRSRSVYRNHQDRFLAECNQPTTSFPLSDSVAVFHRRLRSYCAKSVQIRFGFWLTGHVLVKLIRFRSKPVCKNHPAHFCPLQADRIRHLYWVFILGIYTG